MSPRKFLRIERRLIRTLTADWLAAELWKRERIAAAIAAETGADPSHPRPIRRARADSGLYTKSRVLAAAAAIARERPGSPISDQDLIDATGLPRGTVTHWVYFCRHSGEWTWPRGTKGRRRAPGIAYGRRLREASP